MPSLKPLFSLLSPAGPQARLSILIFHRVLAAPDPLLPGVPDVTRFDAVCRWLADWFHVLPLDVAVRRLREGALPARAASITFDDGYADNYELALPVLQRCGLSATFFIATGFLGGGRMFNDSIIEIVRRANSATLDLSKLGVSGLGVFDLSNSEGRLRAISDILHAVKYRPLAERDELTRAIGIHAGVDRLPEDLMMTPAQVLALHHAGMQIGAHTVSHPILAQLDTDSARAEVVGSRDALQDLLGEPVTLFAYPNGKPDVDYSVANVELVKAAGFDAAFSTAWGAVNCSSDRHQLPRFTPWDTGRAMFGLRLIRNLRLQASRAFA